MLAHTGLSSSLESFGLLRFRRRTAMGHSGVIIAVSITVSPDFAPDGDPVTPYPAPDLGVAEPGIEAPHDDDARHTD